jgi:hypothetical protein
MEVIPVVRTASQRTLHEKVRHCENGSTVEKRNCTNVIDGAQTAGESNNVALLHS